MLIIINALVCIPAWAQKPVFLFDNITAAHGLTNTNVLKVLQDRQGYIWAATQEGLFRYDGYQFKVFKHDAQDPTSLAGNYIQHIFEDSRGVLWLSIPPIGFAQYHPQTETFTNYAHQPDNPNSLSSNIVMSVAEDSNGDLLIATLGGGLNRYNPHSKTFSHYRHDSADPNSLSDDLVYSVLADRQGIIWVGTRDGGLNQLDSVTGQFTRYLHDPNNSTSLSGNKVYKLFEDSNGSLWVGTRGGGLNRFDRKTESFQRYRHDPNVASSLGSDYVYDIFSDKAGSLWVATEYGGLNRFDASSNGFVHYRHDSQNPHSLSGDDVMSVTQDHSGLLWLGIFGRGLSKFDPDSERFGLMQHDPNDSGSLSEGPVNAIFKDKAGVLWVGNRFGLDRYDNKSGQFQHFYHHPDDPKSLSDSDVSAIYEDAAGYLWVGTYTRGLNRLNKQTNHFQHFRHQPNDINSLSDDRVYSIAADQQGYLWVGTDNGLNRLDPQTNRFTRYRHSDASSNNNSISHDHINALFSDENGTLWIGTKGGGLNGFDVHTQQFSHYQHDATQADSISHDTVETIAQGPEGHLWIGTGTGLNRFNPQTGVFSRYQQAAGLASDNIFAILTDGQGRLWLGGDSITLFDPQTSKVKSPVGAGANCASEGAHFQATDGQLFFGRDGYCAFYPAEVIRHGQAPTLVLTDFRLLNKSVPMGGDSPLSQVINHTEALTLTHEDNVLSFEFSALHYARPKSNQYRYKLVGFNPGWIDTNWDNRRATYTNLPAGKYTFVVKASNHQGVWSEQGRSIELTILPAPWRTWWAYSLYLLMGLGIVGLFAVQQVKKQQAIKIRNEQLRLALWGSGDELWDIDLKKNTIVSKNRLKCLHSVDSNHWQLSHGYTNIIHPDDKTMVEQAIKRHFDGQVAYYEAAYRAQTNSNEWIWLLDRGKVSERDEKGQPVRFSGTTKNIDQLKVTEIQLRTLTEELESRVERRTAELKQSQAQLVESEKMAALGSLVIGVSHEINTPVGIAITAITNLKDRITALMEKMAQGKLRKQDFDSFSDNAEQSISLALSNMVKTSSFVEYFKQIAVDQSGEQTSSVKLAQLLNDCIETTLLQQKVSASNITVDCPADLTMTTYYGALVKVFSQLVHNSVCHGYTPGERVEIVIKVTQQNDQIVIHYADKGKGLDSHTLAHIFDPFYTTNRGNSTGLGMHVVYNQVSQLLGGSIQCDGSVGSESAGGGCGFVVRLPCGLS